jgi:hypothetical protein
MPLSTLTLQSSLAGNQEQQLELDDRELIMAIVPLFQQQLEAAEQRGLQQGIQQGQRSILESFFRVRFGELDPILAAFLTPVSTLPATAFTMLLLQLSALTVDAQGMQQAKQLLAENVLRMRFGEIDDTADATLGERFPVLLQNLLALSAEELTLLLQQWLQLSNEEILTRLSD